jgi:hypothetical protein
MNATPPPADLSKLKGILGKAKAVMNTVDTGSYQTGNVNGSALVQDTSNYVESQNVPVENRATSIGDPSRQMRQPSKETIMNSKMPDSIKKAMMENPIAQPTMNHTFNLDDVSDLIDKPMPAPQARPQQRVNENVVHNQANDTFTVSESALRGIIKDVLIEYLASDYQRQLSEGVIKKTINTLIKEGKIRTKSR